MTVYSTSLRKTVCYIPIFILANKYICYTSQYMFGKIKDFAVRKVLERQLKDVPEDQKQMIMTLVEKDPKLFEKIAKELQAEMKTNGDNQMAAAMKVLPKYQKEILAVMPQDMKEKLAKMQMGSQGQFNPNGTIRK